MTRMTFVASGVLLLIALSSGTADAQAFGPRSTSPPVGPTVSPYLNLVRNPNAPTLNYFGLVRPQFQTNAGLRALQQQLLGGQSSPLPGAEPTGDVLVTGHAAVFMNYGGYFQSQLGAMQATRYVPTTFARQTTSTSTSTSTSTPTRLPRPGPR